MREEWPAGDATPGDQRQVTVGGSPVTGQDRSGTARRQLGDNPVGSNVRGQMIVRLQQLAKRQRRVMNCEQVETAFTP